MKVFDVVTPYETYKDCFFVIEKYQADESLALQIWNREDGPIATATVCLSGRPNIRPRDGQAYLDTNNCPWIERLLDELGIAHDTEIMGMSGFCVYPLYQFDMAALANYAS